MPETGLRRPAASAFIEAAYCFQRLPLHRLPDVRSNYRRVRGDYLGVLRQRAGRVSHEAARSRAAAGASTSSVDTGGVCVDFIRGENMFDVARYPVMQSAHAPEYRDHQIARGRHTRTATKPMRLEGGRSGGAAAERAAARDIGPRREFDDLGHPFVGDTITLDFGDHCTRIAMKARRNRTRAATPRTTSFSSWAPNPGSRTEWPASETM